MEIRDVECSSPEDTPHEKQENGKYECYSDRETCLSKAEEYREDIERNDLPKKHLSFLRTWLPSVGGPVSLLGVILMSFSDIFMEISTRVINPIQLTVLFALAMFMTSLVCSVMHAIKDKTVLLRRYNKIEWFYLLLCAITNAGGITLINFAIKAMPVGDAVSVLRSMPAFAAVIGWIFLKQSLRIVDFPLILFCISGVVLIARPSFLFQNSTDNAYGNGNEVFGTVLALGSAFCFALSFSVGKKLSDSHIQSYIIISINSCVNLCLNCVIWFAFRRWDCAQSYVIFLALAGGVLTAFGQILVFWSVSREKVVVITVILASNIVFVYVLQILIVHIIPHWLSGVGALLILIACVGMAIRKDDKVIQRTVEVT